MQGRNLFEYAIVRIVPRVEREEFLNAGVILYCRDLDFLATKFELNEKLLRVFCEPMDCREVKDHLLSFEKISRGDKDGGPIAALDIASRFRWLTATRSTVIQSSKVHSGFTNDPQATLNQLFEQMVTRNH